MRYAVIITWVLLGLLLAFELWFTVGTVTQPGAGLGIIYLLPLWLIQAVLTLTLIGLESSFYKSLSYNMRLLSGISVLVSFLWVPLLFGVMRFFE